MPRLLILTTLLVGIFFGAAAFTFGYGKGASYLTNDPAACANCHVMEDYLAAWTQSSHRDVAVCNDCHAPHDLVGKYVTKAINGWNHSVAFTTGNYPENMRVTPLNRRVTEAACRDCHSTMVAQIAGGGHAFDPDHGDRACATCHADVGHREGPPILTRAPSTSITTLSHSRDATHD